MRRTILAAVFTSLIAGWAGSASAVFVDSAAHYIRRGYYRNVQWPWPYVCPDRIAAREPFDIMIRNGWRRQNLIGSHYFQPGTNKLNVAGELQVRWIMTQAPPARRQVFIERSVDPNVTAARLATVREYATQVAIDGRVPPVAETSLMAEGRPAATVDWTNVQFIEHMPPPVLPPSQGSSLSQ
jgi:hypothetical protein